MNDFQAAAQEAQRHLKGLSALATIAPKLEQIGNLEAHLDELKKRIETFTTAEQAARDRASAAAQEAEKAETEAQRRLTSATEEARRIITQANQEAGEIRIDAAHDRDERIKEGNEEVARIADATVVARKQLADVKAEFDQASSRLAVIKDETARIKERL